MKATQYKNGIKTKQVELENLKGLEFSHQDNNGNKWFRDCGLGVYVITKENYIPFNKAQALETE
jgi:hypothetical protein